MATLGAVRHTDAQARDLPEVRRPSKPRSIYNEPHSRRLLHDYDPFGPEATYFPCGGSPGTSSLDDIRIVLRLRIVEVLQVEVEGLLRVEELIVDRRLELPAHFDAHVLQAAIARLCRLADFHLRITRRHDWLQRRTRNAQTK